LADQKLITLNNKNGQLPSVLNIQSNPKQFHFIEMDAAQLPRALDDVDAAAITNTYAAVANLKLKDSIAHEGGDSPYVNVFVVRLGDLNTPQYKELLESFQSEPVIEKAKALFGEGAIPGFVATPIPDDFK
jgi:D-methionine transport system substrate-binding protein